MYGVQDMRKLNIKHIMKIVYIYTYMNIYIYIVKNAIDTEFSDRIEVTKNNCNP